MAYKLTYFDIKGKAEVLRYIFALAGREYEDNRVEIVIGNPDYSDAWQTLKPGTLWGTLPELEFDNLRICSTPAIARFLGKQFGLAGSTPFELAKIDMIISCTEDVFSAIGVLQRVPREQRAGATKEQYDKFRGWVRRLEELLISNKPSDWFIGEKVTIADAYVYHLSTLIAWCYPDLVQQYTQLQAMFQRFEQLPAIASWFERRPKSVI